ncbi:Zn-dependent protease with chaperone function [Allocatelliglobosispora scoriae]|uniref:Zn-dependent protease with chaperone function n=1 Tax=Allocatelliglobosispora scoriae TaxID=643052 RepID=A0A841C339_9ACTN|nr:M56 family metallopeptidase [Allocatelliglobosispora scoriae]MBB5874325.1 Zn-dependent protease with chaperone function [Allocatelliglobosispora scoriae]
MRTWVYLPLLLSVALPWASRWMSARAAPSLAARTVAAAAVVAGTASVCCLALLALTLFDDLPPLSAYDHRPDLGLPKPVPGWVALAAAVLLLAGSVRLGRLVRIRMRVLGDLRQLGRPNAGLVIADSPEPFAVAVPGRPGHILMTSGMLRLLDVDERRVLFAHEQAHLARGHHRLVSAAAWAAAVNPLLRPMASLVSHLVERWADEDAAAEVGDRELVARAVAKASLAGSHRRFEPAMGLHGAGAVQRVSALIAPRRQHSWRDPIAVVGLSVSLLAAVAVAVLEFVEVAEEWLALL